MIQWNRFGEAFRSAVNEMGPDYVYNERFGGRCWYTYTYPSGEVRSSCIIGKILHEIGVSLAELTRFDEEYTSGNAYDILMVLKAPEGMAMLAYDIQWDNDTKKPWGEMWDEHGDRAMKLCSTLIEEA